MMIVYLYTTKFLSVSFIWYGFPDAIKEGDGDGVLFYWKFLLILKATQCQNYCKEVVNLLLQAQALSPRLVAQLKWSRFLTPRNVQDVIYHVTFTWNT